MSDALTGQTVELLQQMIRNQCVNDGTVQSGQEVRTSDLLRTYLEAAAPEVGAQEIAGADFLAGLHGAVVHALVADHLLQQLHGLAGQGVAHGSVS